MELPKNVLLYGIYFLHSGFLNNLRLPWKTEGALNSLYWMCFLLFRIFEQLALALKIFAVLNIFFIIQDFWATCACPEKQSCHGIFHCAEIYFIIQDFWGTCGCPENRVCPENFQARGGGGGRPRPASYAYACKLWSGASQTRSTTVPLA